MLPVKKDELMFMLGTHDCQITFTKVDGTKRVMKCTLRENELPKMKIDESKKDVKKNDDLVVVWDLDKSAWRSFKFKSITEVFVLETD